MDEPKPTKKQASQANQAVFEEFFQDYHRRRKQVYFMNFVRGIWFGLGSVMGGTLVLALTLWLLSLFQQIPFLTDFTETIQRSIENARH